jgi:hypothetical protein
VVDEVKTSGASFRNAVRDQIALGDNYDALLDAQQLRQRQMLDRLRLDQLVRGDHQQHGLDTSRPSDHRLNELLMPRHVDQVDLALGGVEVRETQHDGHPPRLLLREPVGLHPREGAY